ncbi:ABC transporter ATP-binding protein [Puniceicoccus vermicola]|uniref:ABC transporter ATP-binding protein n=1 Tax=Puniceicoccus vermicola TaxID=388746 RepID=A0A7X1AVM4_9BACT|nr:ABC transporter ATP-binding protein [Puniceicoccus vermicola]MBC2600833.1 ABC transporter ATP-binding protein [Puniceicoccus vermicola]
MNIIFRVSNYLFRYPWLFAATLGLAIGTAVLAISVPKIIQYIVDNYIAAKESNMLLLGVGVIMVVYIFRELLNCFRIRLNNILEQKVLLDLRQDLHNKLLALPISFFDQRKSGDVASRVIDDVTEVERALLDGTEQGSVAVLTIFGITIFLFTMQPLLAALVLVPIPILFILAYRHAKYTRKNWRQVRDSSGLLNSLLVEDIQGNRLIQSFNLTQRETERFRDQSLDLRKKTLKAMFRYSRYISSVQFISSLGVIAVVGIGGWMVIQEKLTMGQFIAFNVYCTMLYQPIFQLNSLNHMISAGKAAGERVFEVLDHPVDIENSPNPVSFPSPPVSVTFDHVEFSYADRSPVLHDFELTLPSGKVTAIVGHTGAGKSTIANLILRYYDVSAGSVRLNDTDVRNIELGSLRSQIGVVAQDPFLFDATVRDNLLLARIEATETEIWEALEGASAADFVRRLPDGLETLIGERGIRLSMGEKQRLTIARVLLRNPPLVILDEATSSVDTITEKQIQEALDHLVQHRTVLVIAHRLSTVRRADQIVVVEHGRILEKGTHDDLIQNDGHYSNLWRHQTELIPS